MKKIGLAFGLAALGCGCVRIPKEAIQVNTILHGNIVDAQRKHEALVHAFFDVRRDAMDEWFLQTYEPQYLKNFQIVWDKARATDKFDIAKPAHRLEYEQNVIARHQEMDSQLRATEEEFRAQLEQAYGSMLQQNEAIGKLLTSAKSLTDAEKNSWNTTVGKLIPGLSTVSIDDKIKKLRDEMVRTVGGT